MNAIAFIVVWTVTLNIPTECPDYRPDPYTGQYPSYSCAVMHYKTVTEEKSAMCTSRESAEKFIADAPAEIKPTMRILEESQ